MRLPDLLHRDINWRVHGKAVLRYAVLAFAVLYALNMGWVRPLNRYRGIAESKSTGLGAVTEYPEYDRPQTYYAAAFTESEGAAPDEPQSGDRQMVRFARLSLTVTRPTESAERVQQLAQQYGGYLVKAELTGSGEYESASLQIRVPANRYAEVRVALRRLALHVDSEESTADDVTKRASPEF